MAKKVIKSDATHWTTLLLSYGNSGANFVVSWELLVDLSSLNDCIALHFENTKVSPENVCFSTWLKKLFIENVFSYGIIIQTFHLPSQDKTEQKIKFLASEF